LTYKAEEIGYHPEMILAGRRLNDNMAAYVASRVIKLMIGKSIQPAGARVLVLGLTFKENCPDVRNTKVADLIRELMSFRCAVDVHDPWAGAEAAKHEYGFELVATPAVGAYDAVVLAVPHRQFAALGAAGIRRFCRPNAVLYDVKQFLPKDQVDERL
jgi:UDP-N-acetyl-D-galactosamine dehydrogenase